jgi:hypothetical protein
MAPTDSPAEDRFALVTFNGTSCANPNLAGITSPVWSVNSALRGDNVRQILVDTAEDLGAAGRDNYCGSGLVNADAAARRATTRSDRLRGVFADDSIIGGKPPNRVMRQDCKGLRSR